MSLTIDLEERPEQHVVGVPIRVDLAHWGEANALVPLVYGWLADHGAQASGGPLYRYLRIQSVDQPMDLSVNAPVASPLTPGEGLVSSAMPSGRYVVGRYQGSPDGLREVHAAMIEWSHEHEVELDVVIDQDGEHWAARSEQFLTDPQAEPDRNRWQVEVLYLAR